PHRSRPTCSVVPDTARGSPRRSCSTTTSWARPTAAWSADPPRRTTEAKGGSPSPPVVVRTSHAAVAGDAVEDRADADALARAGRVDHLAVTDVGGTDVLLGDGDDVTRAGGRGGRAGRGARRV